MTEVLIVDYDPDWPRRFEVEAKRIAAALGSRALAVARMLTFRDRLRAERDERELYESTKRALAEQQWPTGQHYADAKSDVVEAILRRARAGDQLALRPL